MELSAMSTALTDPAPVDAVIIPHYNDPPRLERCLRALMENDIANTEIVVVDNASPVSLDLTARARASPSEVTTQGSRVSANSR